MPLSHASQLCGPAKKCTKKDFPDERKSTSASLISRNSDAPVDLAPYRLLGSTESRPVAGLRRASPSTSLDKSGDTYSIGENYITTSVTSISLRLFTILDETYNPRWFDKRVPSMQVQQLNQKCETHDFPA